MKSFSRLTLVLALTALWLTGCYPKMVETDREIQLIKAQQRELEEKVSGLEKKVLALRTANNEQLMKLRGEVREVEAALKRFVAAMKNEVADTRSTRAQKKRAMKKKRDEFVDKNLERTFSILEKVLEKLEKEIDKSLQKAE